MDKALKTIRKYVLVYLMFLKNSMMTYMEYRANLIMVLFMEIVYLLSKLMYLAVFYGTNIKIPGVSADEIMIFIGTFMIMTAIFCAFFMDNFYQLPNHIRAGTLDIYITKPLSLQFMVTMRHINFIIPVPNIITGIVLVVMAWKKLGIQVNTWNITGYILIIISSSIVAYAVFMMPQILSFWTVKAGAITEITDRCWDFNNMPMVIYNKWIQRIGIFIFPVFVIVNFPALFVLGKLTAVYTIWIIIAPIVFLTINRLFWNYAVRSYSSASS